MRRFAKFFLTLGLCALPLSAQAQYPHPAYYQPRPMPVYSGPYTNYGWQATPYGNPYAYPPAQNWRPPYYPPAYYSTARPMPAAPMPQPTYTVASSPAAKAPQNSPKQPTTEQITMVSIAQEDALNNKANEPAPPVEPKALEVPEVISVQPPKQTPPAASLPASAGPETAVTASHDAVQNCPFGCQNCKQQKFFIFGDFLYLTVRGADIPYAQAFDGVGPLAVPRGPVAVADPDYHAAFRTGGGVALGDGCWIQGAFFFYESDTSDQIAAIPTTAIRSYLTFPTTLNSAFTSLEASARYDIDLYMAEIDYKAPLCLHPNATVNWLVGVRYAHLDEALDSTFQLLGETNVDSTINFDGVGPRVGLDGEFRGRHGLFGYGKGVFNLLAGHFNANYEQRNINTGLQAQTEIGDDRIVPVLEFELGGGWISSNGHVRISGGYYISSWFNTLTTNSLVRGVQASNFTTNGDNFRDTLTFDGFVGRVEFRY